MKNLYISLVFLVISITGYGQYQVGEFVSDTLFSWSYSSIEGCSPGYDIVFTVNPAEPYTIELPTGLTCYLVIDLLIPQDGAPTADIALQDGTLLEEGMMLPFTEDSLFYELLFWSAQTVHFSYVVQGIPEVAGQSYFCNHEFEGQIFPCQNLAFLSPIEGPDTCQVALVDGIVQLFTDNFKVFPNPSDGSFRIHLDGASKQLDELVIYDSLGELIIAVDLRQISSKFIDLESFDSGLYHIVGRLNGRQQLTQRVIVH